MALRYFVTVRRATVMSWTASSSTRASSRKGFCLFSLSTISCSLLVKQSEHVVVRTNLSENCVLGIIIVHVLDGHHPVQGQYRLVAVIDHAVVVEISVGPGGSGRFCQFVAKMVMSRSSTRPSRLASPGRNVVVGFTVGSSGEAVVVVSGAEATFAQAEQITTIMRRYDEESSQ